MNLKTYIIALMVLGLCWSCNDDDDANYKPDRPTSGTVYTVSVGVDKTTADRLGGEDVVMLMLYTNFESVSRMYNTAGEFNEMHFFMENFYTYEGVSESQLNHSNSTDYTLIINGSIEKGDLADGYYPQKSFVHLSANTIDYSRMFSHAGISYFVYATGLTQEAIDISAGDVDLSNNPIAASGYEASSSYMNSKNIAAKWDDLSVKLIRDGKGYKTYIPSEIDLTIKNLLGTMLDGVDVKVYPVLWGSGTVMEDPIFEGTTDLSGNIVLNTPYNVPAELLPQNKDYLSNLFVKIEKHGVVGHFFIPITDAILYGINNGSSSYKLDYNFDLTTLDDIRVTQYSFDDATNLMTNEANIGVSSNVIHTTDSKIGTGAVQFDGAQYIVLDKDNRIDAGSDYSIGFWFKTSTDSGGQNSLWTMSSFSGDATDDPWVPGGLTMRYASDNISYDIGWEGGTNGSASVVDGQWHHIVTTVKYTGSDAADITVYIDGIELFKGNNNIKKPFWGEYWTEWTGEAPVDDFVIKIGHASTAGDAATPFTGVIDDIHVFNQALSESLVYELFNQ